jgi:hypothetical protein
MRFDVGGEEPAGALALDAACGTEEAVVADLGEAGRQDVLKKSGEELVCGKHAVFQGS